MSFFIDFITNHIILGSVLAWFVAQVFKVIITLITDKRFRIERMFGDGGMPSGHSASVMALAILTGHTAGFGSPVFAVAGLLAVIVMHDATGVRRETGKQAVTLLQILTAINDMLSEKDKIVQNEKLKVLVGHSHLQVFCGALLGAIVSLIYIAFLG